MIRDLIALVKSIPDLFSASLNRQMGIKEGLNYKTAIAKELNNARILGGNRLLVDQPLILEALKQRNVLLAYGIKSEADLQRFLRKDLQV